jgi:hypothetical protein
MRTFHSIVAAFCLLSGGLVFAQTRTTVKDILYYADGSRVSGQVEITWDAFTSADGKTVSAGKLVRKITDGVLELALIPNEGAVPESGSYLVSYLLSNGTSYQEYWKVPRAGPVAISTVRIPAPSAGTPVTGALNQEQLALGTGLATLLGLYRANSPPTATAAGQCYWDLLAATVKCSTGPGTSYAVPPGGAPGGAAGGDLGGTYPVPSVAAVGGSTAANVHSAELAANAATDANTAGAIVKRDASGNFSAGTVTANLSGNVTGNVTGNASTATALSTAGTSTTVLHGNASGPPGYAAVTGSDFNVQNANRVFAGPASGTDATPTFRSLVLGDLPFGSANQVPGTNAAGTSQEHKTLAVGSTGTDFNIEHTAGTITFHVPSASLTARGLVTTGTQSFAGAKTFTGSDSGVYNANWLVNRGHLKFTQESAPGAPTAGVPTDGGSCTDGAHAFRVTFLTANGETEPGTPSGAQTCGAPNRTIPLTDIPTGTTGVVTGRNVCVTKAGGSTYYQLGASPTIADNTTVTYDFATADESLTTLCSPANTTAGGIVNGGFAQFTSVNNVLYVDRFPGSDAAEKMVACFAAVPETGGTCDARGLQGLQTGAIDIFAGLTKPLIVLWPLGVYTSSVPLTFDGVENLRVLGAGGIGGGLSAIEYSGSATAAFNFVGARYVTFENMLLRTTNEASPPKVNVVLGRNAAGRGSDSKLLHCTIEGYATHALFYSVGEDGSVIFDSYFRPWGGGAKYAAFWSETDTLAVGGGITAGTALVNSVIASDFISIGIDDANAASVVVVEGNTMNLAIRDSYIYANKGYGVEIRSTSNGQAQGPLVFDNNLIEYGAGAGGAFHFVEASGGVFPSLQGITISNNNAGAPPNGWFLRGDNNLALTGLHVANNRGSGGISLFAVQEAHIVDQQSGTFEIRSQGDRSYMFNGNSGRTISGTINSSIVMDTGATRATTPLDLVATGATVLRANGGTILSTNGNTAGHAVMVGEWLPANSRGHIRAGFDSANNVAYNGNSGYGVELYADDVNGRGLHVAKTTGNVGYHTADRTGNTTPVQRADIWGGNAEVADPAALASESLADGTFASCPGGGCKWGVTAGWDATFPGNTAKYDGSSGAGNLTQTAADMAMAGVASRWYKFSYTVSSPSGTIGATITTAFASAATTLPLTAGAQTVYFKSAAGPGVFTIAATGTGSFTIDALSLKEVIGGDVIGNGTLRGRAYATAYNCASTASPAACAAAPAGAVVIAAAATSVLVNTTAVTATSRIFVQEDSSLGTQLGVTCNTTIGRTYAVTARTAATSFAITASAAPVTNSACLSFWIIN